MSNNSGRRSLSHKEIEDVLGNPPFKVFRAWFLGLTLVLFGLFFLLLLGGGAFKGHNPWGITINWDDGFLGFVALVLFGLGCIVVPAVLFGALVNAFRMRNPYNYTFKRLLRGEVFPDFYMPKKALGTHFLFVDHALGRLFTSHSNYKDGYPVDDLYQLTCGFEGKRHYMVLRFRSGDSPELHITAASQKDANQQIIRLQNYLGWN